MVRIHSGDALLLHDGVGHISVLGPTTSTMMKRDTLGSLLDGRFSATSELLVLSYLTE